MVTSDLIAMIKDIEHCCAYCLFNVPLRGDTHVIDGTFLVPCTAIPQRAAFREACGFGQRVGGEA